MDVSYYSQPVLQSKADVLILATFRDPQKDSACKFINKAVGGNLFTAMEEEGFEGKSSQSITLRTTEIDISFSRIVVLGAGSAKNFSPDLCLSLSAKALAVANRLQATTALFVVPAVRSTQLSTSLAFAARGAVLGNYRFNKYKTSKDQKKAKSLTTFLIGSHISGAKKAQAKPFSQNIKRAIIIAESTCLTRDLVNEPAEFMSPTQLAKTAKTIAKNHGLKVKILSATECKKLGMGMYLAVGQGSAEPHKFIHLTYTPKKKPKKRIALIGKGVTFDSGGYSLKPSASMMDMKIDMAGSAAVLGAMNAIGQIGCANEVHAVVAACENMVSGDAYRLGDVLQAMDGTTVEVNNTDAEGRLTLGDAITYTRTKIQPDEMFDFATLTGACMVALGPYTAGVFSDNQALAKRWLQAADTAGEDMWRLPLRKSLKKQLKSNIADMKNTGERWGGAITAGLFLQHFVKDTTWLHVDLAGPASAGSSTPAVPKGGTGFAVATIVQYLTTT